ncbi:hypothetical protein CONLIGDRAFT_684954 [Coniochaeta ligniaria NRRL 30616]|uniref:Uncharacterized protein n=1 Tax=Coniochaeta ligniaria NRRL 30616 TaxID=1408157 RepID=A0A1J7JBY0_9PEZI|nr:hypothetical protein CONLIGDRAFT_684954 [Coniochaeta ligniaria NRRL 30616]
MGVRAGHQIVATTTLKEAEVNGLQTIIEQQVQLILTQTAHHAVGEVQDQLDKLKERLTEHKRKEVMKEEDLLTGEDIYGIDELPPSTSLTRRRGWLQTTKSQLSTDACSSQHQSQREFQDAIKQSDSEYLAARRANAALPTDFSVQVKVTSVQRCKQGIKLSRVTDTFLLAPTSLGALMRPHLIKDIEVWLPPPCFTPSHHHCGTTAMDFPHLSTTQYYDNDGDAVMLDSPDRAVPSPRMSNPASSPAS